MIFLAAPTRDQIVEFISQHPNVSTTEIVAAYEDPTNKIAYTRAYNCVWVKLTKLADRGEVVRMSNGARKDGQRWSVNKH